MTSQASLLDAIVENVKSVETLKSSTKWGLIRLLLGFYRL